MLYIKSQSNLEEPEKGAVLYKKDLWKHRVPLAKFRQVIVTVIGTFSIKVNLKYLLSLSAKIILEEYRNIIIETNYSTSLTIDLTFSYGICYVLEFGLFVKGNLVRADIEPKF